MSNILFNHILTCFCCARQNVAEKMEISSSFLPKYNLFILRFILHSAEGFPLHSGETLFQIYRRLIGRPYIVLAQKDKIYRNISDALGRTKYVSQYIGCTQEAQIRPRTFQFISQHITVHCRKNGRLQQKINLNYNIAAVLKR